MSRYWLIVVFVVSLLLRLWLIPNPGFEADISFWKSWGLATFDRGIVEGLKVSNNNYPTPFAYILGAMVWIYSLLADPHNFNQFWSNTNLLFLTIAKLFPILADFGIAVIIFKLTRSKLLTAAYLLSPIAIIDGALWGQVDSLGVFIFLISVILALKRQPFIAGFVFMLSMMTKLQNMIYGPLFFLFVWQTVGFSGLVRAVAGALIGFFGLNLEFFLAREMGRVIDSLTSNYDYFPYLSLNAFNPWWIVARGHGMAVSDKITVLGMINAKTLGLLLFSGFYLFAGLKQFLAKQVTLRVFLESLIIVNAAFFFFQTQSHDRYLFPASVFLLLWVQLKSKNKFWFYYLIFTIFYFYNLHTALILNYPHNGLPWLSQLIQPPFTIFAAIILLLLFAIYLFTILRSSFFAFVISFATLLVLLFAMNYKLITKQPVSLVKFTPLVSAQGYGRLMKNMSVQSFAGVSSWNRLSVQYVFYRTGFGTHAASRQMFDLNRRFKRFTTDYGVDTEAGPQASAIFEVLADDQLLFRSKKMGRYDLPQHLEVDVANIKYLTLITTDAGDGITDDHVDWLNPVLYQ